MIDYKARAEFWRKAAEGNLDLLANAYREIKRLEDMIKISPPQTLYDAAKMQQAQGGLGAQLGGISGLTHGRT